MAVAAEELAVVLDITTFAAVVRTVEVARDAEKFAVNENQKSQVFPIAPTGTVIDPTNASLAY